MSQELEVAPEAEIQGVEADEVEAAPAETQPEPTESANDAAGEGEVEVQIAGETPAEETQQETPVIRQLRNRLRDAERRARAAEEQSRPQPQGLPVLGREPGLFDDGIDGDEEKFRAAVRSHFETKAKIDRAREEQEAAIRRSQDEWQQTLNAYESEKRAIAPKIRNFEDLEANVTDTLNAQQLAVLLTVGRKRGELMAALGANPATLKRVAAITSPLLLAAELREIETKMTLAPKRATPAPETVVRGNTRAIGSLQQQLERAREEATQTGRMDNVMALKKRIKQAEAAA